MRRTCNCMQSFHFVNNNKTATANIYTNDSCDSSELPDSNSTLENCLCGYDEENNGLPENPILGQSYVPIQEFNKTFPCDVALKMGTLYPELVRSYYPGQSICDINRIKALNEKGACNS